MNIVVPQQLGLSQQQKDRLRALGTVTYYDTIALTKEEWISRVEDADIICSNKYGIRQWMDAISNKFISLRSSGIGWIDTDLARQQNLTIRNTPGCNRHAVAEWVTGMLITLSRKLHHITNTTKDLRDGFATTSLYGKTICILGKGNIGQEVAAICKVFHMQVRFHTRETDLYEQVKGAHYIVNCLSKNSETEQLLDADFFEHLKGTPYFISISEESTYDLNALIQAVDTGIVAGAALDMGSITPGNTQDATYQQVLKHPHILVTPHLAYDSDASNELANDMMIANVETWVKQQ